MNYKEIDNLKKTNDYGDWISNNNKIFQQR